jgi:hypothetical protein
VQEPLGGSHPSGIREVGGFRWLALSTPMQLAQPKVWRDEPCHRMLVETHEGCPHCGGTGRVIEPAS